MIIKLLISLISYLDHYLEKFVVINCHMLLFIQSQHTPDWWINGNMMKNTNVISFDYFSTTSITVISISLQYVLMIYFLKRGIILELPFNFCHYENSWYRSKNHHEGICELQVHTINLLTL